VNPKS